MKKNITPQSINIKIDDLDYESPIFSIDNKPKLKQKVKIVEINKKRNKDASTKLF